MCTSGMLGAINFCMVNFVIAVDQTLDHKLFYTCRVTDYTNECQECPLLRKGVLSAQTCVKFLKGLEMQEDIVSGNLCVKKNKAIFIIYT